MSTSLDDRFGESVRTWKLTVMSWQSELEKLPPNGERWKWTDVVGDGDGDVDRSAAHRVRAAFDRYEIPGGVEYEVSEALQEYLSDRHGIELTGEALLSDAQTTLPVDTTGGETGARGARDDAGREATDDTPVRQRTLTGDTVRVTSDDGRGGRSERGDDWVSAGWTATPQERAAQHPSQAVLTRFNTPARNVDNSVSSGGWVVDPSPSPAVGVTG